MGRFHPRWQAFGTTLGLPQCHASTIETQVVLEGGKYLLLGGAGGGSKDNPFIIWLVGADRVGGE